MSSNDSNGVNTPPFRTPPATPPNTPTNDNHASSSFEELSHIHGQFDLSTKPKFEFFVVLPPELQIKICHLACPAREVVATEEPVDALFNVYDNNGVDVRVPGFASQIIIIGAPRPNIVFAIPELAEAFIKTGVYKPLLVVQGSPKAVYFDPSKDILRLETNMTVVALPPLCLLTQRLNNAADLQLIKQVTMPIEVFFNHESWVSSSLSTFTNLEQLNLIGAAFNAPRAVDEVYMIAVSYDVRTFWLESLCPEDTIVTQSLVDAHYEVDGFVYQGVLAHQMAFKSITDPIEQTYFLQISAQLNSMLALGVDVPSVTVYIEYTI